MTSKNLRSQAPKKQRALTERQELVGENFDAEIRAKWARWQVEHPERTIADLVVWFEVPESRVRAALGIPTTKKRRAK